MRKTATLLLSLGMFVSNSAISYGKIAPETKNSVYLPSNSWVVTELGKKLDQKCYNLTEDWKDKVSASYTCVNSGAPEPSEKEITSVIQSDQEVGLAVPLKKGEGQLMTDLYAGITFEIPCEVKDIIKAVSASERPTECENCTVKIYNSVFNSENYDKEIETMEQEQSSVPEKDFTFNEKTKIYQVSMDTYTHGYILEDEGGRRLFWCRKAANEFEKEKFYDLADVLNAYKEYKEKTTGIGSWYTHWV